MRLAARRQEAAGQGRLNSAQVTAPVLIAAQCVPRVVVIVAEEPQVTDAAYQNVEVTWRRSQHCRQGRRRRFKRLVSIEVAQSIEAERACPWPDVPREQIPVG